MKKTGITAISASPATPATVLLASLLLTVSAHADQVVERKMMIAIDDGSDSEVLINLDDGGSAVAMHDMQLGETRSLVDAEGRTFRRKMIYTGQQAFKTFSYGYGLVPEVSPLEFDI